METMKEKWHKKKKDRSSNDEIGDPRFLDRNVQILKMKKLGYTNGHLGNLFGISGERVRQILAMMERNIKNGYNYP